MNKTEILNIVNEPSKHIQIVKIDGKDSIVYSSKFVELLELIPTMLTKADMAAMLEKLISEANELEDPKYILETSELPLDVDGTTLPLETYALQCYCRGGEDVIDIIEKKIDTLRGEENE